MKSLVLFALVVLLAFSSIVGCGKSSQTPEDVDTDGVDTDGDGVSDELEVAGYYWKDGEFVKWDGSENATYYRTDPTQFSTDQDPYGDGMEVSGVKMDTSVAAPGNHPLVPAYPEIYVSMSSYDVTRKATIQSRQATLQQDSWSNAVTSERSTENSWSLTAGVEASVNCGMSGPSGGGESEPFWHVSGQVRYPVPVE